MESDKSQSAGFLEFLAWVEVHKKQLIAAAVIATVVGLSIYAYLLNQREQEAAAGQALVELQGAADSGPTPSEPAARDLDALAERYAGTSAARQATLMAAGSLFHEGKYAEAQAAFEKFLHQYPGSPWSAQASYGVAACLDARNEVSQALAKYQDLVARYAADPVVPYAKLALARLYEAQNQPQVALTTYDDMTKATATSYLAAQARMRREALLKKHPELAPSELTPTNAVSSLVVTNPPLAEATNINPPELGVTNAPETNLVTTNATANP